MEAASRDDGARGGMAASRVWRRGEGSGTRWCAAGSGSGERRLLADGGRLAALLGAELAGEGPVVGRDADLLLVHEVVAHELLEHVLDCVGDDAEPATTAARRSVRVRRPYWRGGGSLGRVAFDVLHGVHCTRSVKHAEHALLLFVGRHSPLALQSRGGPARGGGWRSGSNGAEAASGTMLVERCPSKQPAKIPAAPKKRIVRAEEKNYGKAKKPGKTTEEDETPVVISSSAVTMHPKGTTPSANIIAVEVQVLETRVGLSNDMTWRQMIAVGVRRLVLARGELDRHEGPGYAARRAELRRKAKEAARTRERQAAAAAQNERQRRATRQRKKRQGRARREGGDREVARRLQRESERDCEER